LYILKLGSSGSLNTNDHLIVIGMRVLLLRVLGVSFVPTLLIQMVEKHTPL